MNFLIINPGSTSKKYAFYKDQGECINISLEKEGENYSANITYHNDTGKIKVSEKEFKHPHKHLFDLLISHKLIKSLEEINAVGVRIVAPGDFFLEHKRIDEDYVARLNEAKEIAPLHLTPILEEITHLIEVYPQINLYGISDSAFHKDKPSVSKYYAINKSDSDKLGLYRYGYHGISISSILHKLEGLSRSIPEKIIVCHLGGGCSITAIKDGKCVDTSMGYSPLEGLTMATRVGDIDPAVIINLMKGLNLQLTDLENYLNKKCGLLGLSNGKSGDIRELLKLESEGDADAELALDDFVYNIKKYIGAYSALLNGADLIVFSGTIGLKSKRIRERVCKDLEYLGVQIDVEKNSTEEDGYIENNDAKVKLVVIKTEEGAEMQRQLSILVNSQK